MNLNNLKGLIDIPFGKRYIGYWGENSGTQIPVSNINEIIDFISKYLGLFNIGLSISTFENGDVFPLFLPFDFDDNNPKNTIKEVVRLWNHLVEGGFEAYLTYSGRRGFHIYLGLVPKPYRKIQLKTVQQYLKNKLSLTTLDRNLFGDRRRLMRVPYTYNIKSGKLCSLIKYNPGKKLDLDYLKLNNKMHLIPKSSKMIERIYHEYPCIEKLVKEDNEPRHLVRFTYVILRLAKGWTEDEIIEEIKSFNWIDFDEEYTRNQIRQIEANGYYPLNCKSLIDLGYCTGVCKYCDDPSLLMKKLGVKK